MVENYVQKIHQSIAYRWGEGFSTFFGKSPFCHSRSGHSNFEKGGWVNLEIREQINTPTKTGPCGAVRCFCTGHYSPRLSLPFGVFVLHYTLTFFSIFQFCFSLPLLSSYLPFFTAVVTPCHSFVPCINRFRKISSDPESNQGAQDLKSCLITTMVTR